MEKQPGLIEPSVAIDLLAQVEYSAGSIVSRTIAEKKVGTVTLFSFDAGQGLSEHSAPFDALVHVMDGEVDIIIGGKEVRAVAGQIVLMPANIPHALKAITQFKMMLIMIRSD